MRTLSIRAAGAALLTSVLLGACNDGVAPGEPTAGAANGLRASISPSGVSITSFAFDSGLVTIGGAAVPFTVTIGNPDGAFTSGSIQTEIIQGSARRVGGTQSISCGGGPAGQPDAASSVTRGRPSAPATAEVVAGGDCTIGSSFVASNTTGGTGVLVAGSAAAEVDLVGPDGVVVSTLSRPVTLLGGAPALTGVALNSSTAVIDGAFVPYTATIQNPGGPLTGIALQGFLHQGGTLRAASGSAVNCGNGAGALPSGTCTFQFGYSATNTAAGSGTLVPGAATLEVQLRGASGTILGTQTLAVTLLSGTPVLSGLTLNSTTAVIGGAFVPYTATIQNPGALRSGVLLQGLIHQGSVTSAAGGSAVNCGAGTAVLPTGTCTFVFGYLASNLAGNGNVLVPGPATLEVQLKDASGLIQSRFVAVTLVSGTPHLTGVTLSASTAVIEGAFVPYTATIENLGATATGVSLQGILHQGSTLRAASGSVVNCSAGNGVVPTGTCTFVFGYSASNGAGGTGTLVPGPAILEIQLRDSNGTVIDSRSIVDTLLPNAPIITGLQLGSDTAVVGGAFASFTVTLQNPTPTASGIAIQSFLHQGATQRAAGGSAVNCGSGAGVLPTGTCNFAFGYLASNSAGGVGTLVPGAATLEVQLRDGLGNVLDRRNVTVTLQNP